jgi:hypothetical protein
MAGKSTLDKADAAAAPPGAENDVRRTNRLWPGDVTAIYNRITS